jgi:RHS repeat-associated protein
MRAGGVGGVAWLQTGAVQSYSYGTGSAEVHVPLADHMGNVRHYYQFKASGKTVTGQLVASYEYDAFGREVRAWGTNTPATSQPPGLPANRPWADLLPFHYSSKLRDADSGFNYYGYRFYDPGAGRWLNRDPIGEEGGMNLCGFVNNDPINMIDLAGLRSFPLLLRPAPRPYIPDRGARRPPTRRTFPTPPTPPRRILPQGTPPDAYPPQMGPAEPSDEEVARRRDNERERERLRQSRPYLNPDNCKNGECKEFAKRELERQRKSGKCCGLISYSSRMDVSKGVWGNIFADVGLFGPGRISDNGEHVGVICGEGSAPKTLSDVLSKRSTVYDNNFPMGITGSFWVDGAYLVVDPMSFLPVTLLHSHQTRTGTITFSP